MNDRNQSDEINSMVQYFGKIRPFNQVLGLTNESMDLENACVRFDMRHDLIGNTVLGTLHGGVISAIMDITGGFVVFLDLFKKMKKQPPEKIMETLTKISTIDLRVDYLRPGIGEQFKASGYVLRTGKKVAVTRMELHNEEQRLIAVGTGTYIVG